MPERASIHTGREHSHHPDVFAETVISRPPHEIGRVIQAAERFRSASAVLGAEIAMDAKETAERLGEIKTNLEKKGASVKGPDDELVRLRSRHAQEIHDSRIQAVQVMLRRRIELLKRLGNQDEADQLRPFLNEEPLAKPKSGIPPLRMTFDELRETPQPPDARPDTADEPVNEKSGIRWKHPPKRPGFEISDADIDRAVDTLGKDGSTG